MRARCVAWLAALLAALVQGGGILPDRVGQHEGAVALVR